MSDELQGYVVGRNIADELKRIRDIFEMPEGEARAAAIKAWCNEDQERVLKFANAWIEEGYLPEEE